MIEERVISTVKKAIAESLAISPAKIELQSRLIDDLGADSLDFVDIVFMLDREHARVDVAIAVAHGQAVDAARIGHQAERACRGVAECADAGRIDDDGIHARRLLWRSGMVLRVVPGSRRCTTCRWHNASQSRKRRR